MSSQTIVSSEYSPDDPLQKMLATARARFQSSEEATVNIRKEALEDLRFAAGIQWPDEIMRSREEDKRPCLTINQLPQFIRQVTNDLRQNRPSITVSPVDDDADIDTAEIIQGMMRHIEYDSHADIAYDTAVTCAVRQSFGYLRVITEYDGPMSFKQVVKIKRIRNPFTVYFDPSCQEPDYSDGNWCFIIKDYTKEEYKSEFPDSKMASLSNWMSIGDQQAGWMSKDNCRVAEYYYIERKKIRICRLSNDQVVLKSMITSGKLKLGHDVKVVEERDSWEKTVCWKKINAVEVIDETEWLGTMIPVVPVLGEEYDINGELILESCIRHARDPQRMYNYWASAETEMIALAPKAPFIGAEGQFEGHEQEWQQANNKSYPYLEYKPTTIGDKLAPPPQRQQYEPAVQAITNARALSTQDLKSTIGMYDPSLGQMGNETSARAILARQQQGHTSNFHFSDNFSRSLKQIGRIILEVFPQIYDRADVVRIISDSGQHSQAKINQPFRENGIDKIYDVTVGKYDIIISTGPSYNTKRQEAAATMMEVVSAWPQLMEFAGDLMVKNFDWPGAQELSDRLHKMLPPQLQDNDSLIPPQAQMQMKQMQTLIQGLTQELNKMSQKVETKTEKIQSDERIALLKVQADLIKTMSTLNSEEAKHAFALEVDHINTLLKAQGGENPDAAAQRTASLVENPYSSAS